MDAISGGLVYVRQDMLQVCWEGDRFACLYLLPFVYRLGIFFLQLFFKVLSLKIILQGLPLLGSWPNSTILFELVPLEPTLIIV